MPTTPHVLIVEDDANIRSLLEAYLSASGFEILAVATGDEGLKAAKSGTFDLLVLDVMLPKMSGYEIAEALREDANTSPILFLTARGAEEDVLKGFELGADDYVVKPFSPKELVARCKALIARHKKSNSGATDIGKQRLHIDRQALSVVLDGKPIDLTAHEFKLLAYMSKRPDRVFERDQLLDVLYPNGEAVGPKTIDVHIHNLRKKLDAADVPIIQTVRGFGYRFVAPV